MSRDVDLEWVRDMASPADGPDLTDDELFALLSAEGQHDPHEIARTGERGE